MTGAGDSSENRVVSAGTWTSLFEDLVAGTIHSMNNCVTVLGVSLELSSSDDGHGDIPVLRGELTELETLIGLMATLSSRSTRDEALEVSGVLDLALTIHALSPATRTVSCTVRTTGVLPPVRVPRSVLLRVLLLIIDSAKRAQASSTAPVVIDITGDADRFTLRAPRGAESGAEALVLASACGGTLILEREFAVFELPSLAWVRRFGGAAARLPDGTTPTRASES